MRWRFAVLMGASVPAVLTGCARDEEPPVALEVLSEDVDMALLDMDTNLTREGVRRARLRADTADFLSEQEIRLTPVELVFYDQQGNELSVITGDHGIFNEATEDMETWGNVVALDRRGDQRLETTRLRYTSQDDRLFGDEPFTLYKDNGLTELRGSAFESDPGLSSVLMYDSSGRTEQASRSAPPPSAPPGGEPAESAGEVQPDSTAAAVTPAERDSTVVDEASLPPEAGSGAPPDTTAASGDTTRVVRPASGSRR